MKTAAGFVQSRNTVVVAVGDVAVFVVVVVVVVVAVAVVVVCTSR
jgi:hypothetical protein